MNPRVLLCVQPSYVRSGSVREGVARAKGATCNIHASPSGERECVLLRPGIQRRLRCVRDANGQSLGQVFLEFCVDSRCQQRVDVRRRRCGARMTENFLSGFAVHLFTPCMRGQKFVTEVTRWALCLAQFKSDCCLATVGLLSTAEDKLTSHWS